MERRFMFGKSVLKPFKRRLQIFILFAAGCFLLSHVRAAAAPLKVLMLGDDGHHRPAELFKVLGPALFDRSIQLTYTDRVEDLKSDFWPVTIASCSITTS